MGIIDRTIAEIQSQLDEGSQADENIAASMLAHINSADPHAQYQTEGEVTEAVSTAIASHNSASDPHPQYQTSAEASEAIAAAIQGISLELPYYPNDTALPTAPETGVVQVGSGLKIANAGVWSDVGGSEILSASELICTIKDFTIDTFSYAGGSITLPAINAKWYVGVDLLTNQAIILPRLGHQGWICVGYVEVSGGAVTKTLSVAPKLHPNRIPRFTKKILNGEAVTVAIMGSSLAATYTQQSWTGMLFDPASDPYKYKVPGTIAVKNLAMGGSPNAFQLAQTGIASAYIGLDNNGGAYSKVFDNKNPPNGRSSSLSGVDLVVLTTLANGGDYRLQNIEAIVRNLRKRGIEVLITTDNPYGAPFTTYAEYMAASLYVDGTHVFNVANTYKCAIADSCAYVVAANLQGFNTFVDAIHQSTGAPNGRTSTPSCGHEVWARAVRSVIQLDTAPPVVQSNNYTFDATRQGFASTYSLGSSAVVAGKLVITKFLGTNGAWGTQSPGIIAVKSGDTVRIQGTVTSATNTLISVYDSTQKSSVATVPSGSFDVTVTVNTTIATGLGLVTFVSSNNAAAQNDTFTLDDLIITVTSIAAAPTVDLLPLRPVESQTLPRSRIVTDLKTPGDMSIVLPADEYHLAISSNNGTLGANPMGASSFARRFCSSVGASQDLLTLTTGQRAAISAHGAVGFAMITYGTAADASSTVQVYVNGTLQKTLTITAPASSYEWFWPIYTPTELAIASATPDIKTIDLRVTAGTLKIAALLAYTSEIEYILPEDISKVGTWTARVTGGGLGMSGYATDAANDYAIAKVDDSARSIYFVCSSNANSKPVDFNNGQTLQSDIATVGASAIKVIGGYIDRSSNAYIKLKQVQSNTDQSTNGYGLHIGGALAVLDR